MNKQESSRGEAAVRQLSERQRTCLTLVADGMTSKQIGRKLGLSPSTVDSHVRSAIERLGASNRNSAAKLVSSYAGLALADELPVNALLPKPAAASLLPPLGGAPNRLSMRRRMFHIVQIAMLGIAGMAAAVVTIAGLVNLFGQ